MQSRVREGKQKRYFKKRMLLAGERREGDRERRSSMRV